MKAIIEGLLYDTTTATVTYAGGNEALYKTQNNAYFKTGAGGITPMTEEAAKTYLGIVDADAYIKEFGNVTPA